MWGISPATGKPSSIWTPRIKGDVPGALPTSPCSTFQMTGSQKDDKTYLCGYVYRRIFYDFDMDKGNKHLLSI